jgi:hypothetical protein
MPFGKDISAKVIRECHSAVSWSISSGIKLYQSTKFHIACYTPLER